jgi:hypothetical protein
MNLNVIYGFDTLEDIDPTMLDIPKTDLLDIFQLIVENDNARWLEKQKMILKII